MGDQLGLTWTYEESAEEGAAVAQDGAAPTSISALPEAARAPVERLRGMLRIGHVRGIEAEIRALDAAAPEARALVAALYASLDRFDLAAMTRQLEGL